MISLLHPSRHSRTRGMNVRRRTLSCQFGFLSTSLTTVLTRSDSLAVLIMRVILGTVTPQSLSLFLRVWWSPVESVYARDSAMDVSRKEESAGRTVTPSPRRAASRRLWCPSPWWSLSLRIPSWSPSGGGGSTRPARARAHHGRSSHHFTSIVFTSPLWCRWRRWPVPSPTTRARPRCATANL